MQIGLPVQYPLVLSDFNETEIFEKPSNLNSHEKQSSRSPVVPIRRRDAGQTDRQTRQSLLSLFVVL